MDEHYMVLHTCCENFRVNEKKKHMKKYFPPGPMKFTFTPVLKCMRCAFHLPWADSLVLKLHLVRVNMIDHGGIFHLLKTFIADNKVEKSDNPLFSSTKKNSRKLKFSKTKKFISIFFFTKTNTAWTKFPEFFWQVFTLHSLTWFLS